MSSEVISRLFLNVYVLGLSALQPLFILYYERERIKEKEVTKITQGIAFKGLEKAQGRKGNVLKFKEKMCT